MVCKTKLNELRQDNIQENLDISGWSASDRVIERRRNDLEIGREQKIDDVETSDRPPSLSSQ